MSRRTAVGSFPPPKDEGKAWLAHVLYHRPPDTQAEGKRLYLELGPKVCGTRNAMAIYLAAESLALTWWSEGDAAGPGKQVHALVMALAQERVKRWTAEEELARLRRIVAEGDRR